MADWRNLGNQKLGCCNIVYYWAVAVALAFYSNDPSSNPAEAYSFFS